MLQAAIAVQAGQFIRQHTQGKQPPAVGVPVGHHVHEVQPALERALLFLHEQQVIALQKGLAVFRQAMTIEDELLFPYPPPLESRDPDEARVVACGTLCRKSL